MAGEVFRLDQRVAFRDVDAAGILFYPRYFEMINQAVEDWFEHELACDYGELHFERRLGIPTVHMDVSFKAPSRLGDVLTFALTVEKLGTRSFTLVHDVGCNAEARLLVRHALVCASLDGIRLVPIPEDIRARMERFVAG